MPIVPRKSHLRTRPVSGGKSRVKKHMMTVNKKPTVSNMQRIANKNRKNRNAIKSEPVLPNYAKMQRFYSDAIANETAWHASSYVDEKRQEIVISALKENIEEFMGQFDTTREVTYFNGIEKNIPLYHRVVSTPDYKLTATYENTGNAYGHLRVSYKNKKMFKEDGNKIYRLSEEWLRLRPFERYKD